VRKLTAKTRALLKKPVGTLMGDSKALAAIKGRGGGLIAVGDRCSHWLLLNGIRPDVVVYDHMCMRKQVDARTRTALDGYDGAAEVVTNPAGEITDALFGAVKAAVLRGRGKILVEGEEDLAALVAIMFAPDGAVVVYGQPDEGIVLVKIDKKAREMARAVYEMMAPIS